MVKTVLIISYYWPPAGGISVLRSLRFAKYLTQSGWKVIVYAPDNAQYDHWDHANLLEIPEDVLVIKRPILEPFGLFKKISRRKKSDSANPVYAKELSKGWIDNFAIWLRGNFFIPDARALWIAPSVRYLTKYLQHTKVDAILSDGPPHTNTVIACKLSRHTGIPWLADFQDPWTQVDYFKMMMIGSSALKKHHKLEQEVFKTARKITIASPSWKADLESIGAKNVDVIYYAYDEGDFEHLPLASPTSFSIIHNGVLGHDRLPEHFLSVIKKIVDENEIFRQKVKLIFTGQVDYSLKNLIAKTGLGAFVEYTGLIKRAEALSLCNASSIQLLLLNKADNAKGRIPGKLFEYLRIAKPILSLGPVDSDVAGILLETGSGICMEYDNEILMESWILNCFDGFMDGKKYVPSPQIKEYEVRKQVAKISTFLDDMIC